MLFSWLFLHKALCRRDGFGRDVGRRVPIDVLWCYLDVVPPPFHGNLAMPSRGFTNKRVGERRGRGFLCHFPFCSFLSSPRPIWISLWLRPSHLGNEYHDGMLRYTGLCQPFPGCGNSGESQTFFQDGPNFCRDSLSSSGCVCRSSRERPGWEKRLSRPKR